MPNPITRCEQLGRSFSSPAGITTVLTDISLSLSARTTYALTGPSGAGKSTLLNLLGLLDTPSNGELWINEQPTAQLNDQQRSELRSRALGFVFQFHHLLPAFTVLENVLMPSTLADGPCTSEQRAWAEHLLDAVGLQAYLQQSPRRLSGGQQQRVAIARAFMNRPQLLLADEPTGNLDSHTASQVFELIQTLTQQLHCATLIVTHDDSLAARCEQQIVLRDGKMQS